jgi:hypothetical protein
LYYLFELHNLKNKLEIPQTFTIQKIKVDRFIHDQYILQGIQQYQHFRFSADAPGHVFVKRRADSEETKVLILLNGAPASSATDLPVQLTPGGLTEERQRYLYRFVRHLVRPSAQDKTCPAPEE